MIYTNPNIELPEEKWHYLNGRTLKELYTIKEKAMSEENVKEYLAALDIIVLREKYLQCHEDLLYLRSRDA
ncbi:hypothetical protein CL634_02810 [bacterium]|nr:hypothetical protein [bacterium]|tara:strand:+ start:125 stop:337 length:213 start_codon:yes stop_codon:yes gene_type:complete